MPYSGRKKKKNEEKEEGVAVVLLLYVARFLQSDWSELQASV